MNHVTRAVSAVSILGLIGACGQVSQTEKMTEPPASKVKQQTVETELIEEVSEGFITRQEPKYIAAVMPASTTPFIANDTDLPATSLIKPATYVEEDNSMPMGASFGTFDYVANQAETLGKQAYKATPEPPDFLSRLTYDDYRMIDFKPEANLFAEEPGQFQVMLDPRGSLFTTEVELSVLDGASLKPVPFDQSKFDFAPLELTDDEKSAVGLAGFRVLSPMNAAGKLDEVMSVKGASFFRALGAGNSYGASARGIAIQTASPDGEEFPVFKQFWIEKPVMGEDKFRFYALMDGPSVTGAYEFTVNVGASTEVEVRASLFARRDTYRVGLAPLTSMFEFGPQDPPDKNNDFRPRVHDSEGLSAMLANGEWIWRPLNNPGTLQLSSFTNEVPRGFGLMQRTRSYENYQDIEAQYEARPSVWVTPGPGWREGQLTLVEIPTPNEYNDNIISFWQLRDPLRKGERMDMTYKMTWGMDAPFRPNLASVHSTRVGEAETSKSRLFVVDFDVVDAQRMKGVEANVSTTSGKVQNVNVKIDEKRNRVRLSFELETAGGSTAELRALLTRVGRPVSETWLYRWSAG